MKKNDLFVAIVPEDHKLYGIILVSNGHAPTRIKNVALAYKARFPGMPLHMVWLNDYQEVIKLKFYPHEEGDNHRHENYTGRDVD